MKMLLTSGGVHNPTIEAALVDLLGKPIAECRALAISTASYGYPVSGPIKAWEFYTGTDGNPMVNLGWKSVGVLELSVLPSIDRDFWEPPVKEADAFLVNGGETMYLAHWLRESGIAEMLPSLNAVWVGLSAGSVVMAPRIGTNFVHWPEPRGNDVGLGLMDFAIFPHLNYPTLPEHTMEHAERWAASIPTPGYAIDEQTAIKVMNGEVEVISEGEWRYFAKQT